MSHRIRIPGHKAERTKTEISATLKDEKGADVTNARLTTATMRLYDKESGTVINSHTATDVKSDVDSNGLLTRALLAADMVLIDTTKDEEVHIALISFTWDADGEAHQEVEFTVKNMDNVG